MDREVQDFCKDWIYSYTTPDTFIQLLYNIGFWGLKTPSRNTRFKSSEAENPGSVSVTHDSIAVVHPSYAEALQLHKPA